VHPQDHGQRRFGTDYCIGFSTCVTRSVEMIANLRTPREAMSAS
jgi:6-phosphofructokinase